MGGPPQPACMLWRRKVSYLPGYETQLVIWDGKMTLTGDLTESAGHGLSEHCHSRHLFCWLTSSTAIYSCTVTVSNISSKQSQYVTGITICKDMHQLGIDEQTCTPLTCLYGTVRHNFTLLLLCGPLLFDLSQTRQSMQNSSQ